MSNLVRHAQRELELVGEDVDTIQGIMNVVETFADMGHSGGSASVAIPMINKLLQHQNLTPLTNNPDEWLWHDDETWGEYGGIWQNKRNSKAFSRDGGKTYYLVDDETKLIHESLKVNVGVQTGNDIEAFTDGNVIGYKGENYYRACGVWVSDLIEKRDGLLQTKKTYTYQYGTVSNIYYADDRGEQYVITGTLWQEMRRPEKITVTIEQGDTLNVGQSTCVKRAGHASGFHEDFDGRLRRT